MTRRASGIVAALCAISAMVAAIPFSTSAADADAKTKTGREIFTKIAEPPCGVCHTLRDAGTTGQIGANLEELKPDANRVAEAVRKGIGVMPPYAGKLTDEQIDAVAQYVSRIASGK
jgi:cytochrome c6